MKRWWPIFILFGMVAGACSDSGKEPIASLPSPAAPKGQLLMTQYCGACHQVPSPADLDQKTWKNHILVRMSAYMGIYNDNIQYYDSVPEKWLEPGIGGTRVAAAGIYPKQPMLSRADWEILRDYIIQNAPQNMPPTLGMLPITRQLDRFTVKKIQPNPDLQPLVSALSIDPQSPNSLYAAFFQQSLLHVTSTGKTTSQVEGLYGPVFLNSAANGLTMVDIGSFKGSDHPKGSAGLYSGIAQIKKNKAAFKWDSLMRPVMARWADLDQDGDQDMVLAEFGYHLGELSWQENQGNGTFTRHTLYGDDGTVAIQIADFNGDSLPDILSLKANADERVDLYINKGKGQFEAKMLFRFNPTYGCTALEVVDWNHDGRLDFLVANGDNGDYPPILKGNHGIRLYLNQGQGQFAFQQEWKMNGAYGLRVRDFDLDGDYDLAAVSFYPDYNGRPDEAFIYFENQGQDIFKAFTFPDVGLGRWMVMDAADIDGDGDQDIVLGAFDIKSSDCSDATYDHWIQENVPLILLENRTK